MQHQPEANTIEPSHLVERPRLTTTLRRRYEHRVTTVVAPAGAGKTAALTLATRNNRLDPAGLDVWIDARPSDNDPVHFVATIARALGVGTILEEGNAVDRIHDVVWSHAPLDVAIVIDEAHELASAGSTDVLRSLIRDLPTNGHLVLAGRSVPPVPLARLRAHRQLLELTSDHLELDDDELEALRDQRGRPAPAVDLTRHAATADLQLAVGSDASVEFLWQEVLAGLEPDRLASLRLAALVEQLDDRMVRGLSDGRFDVDALLVDLPLIDRRDDGTARLHSLLREALTSGLDPSDRRKGLEQAAQIEAEREQFAEAVRLYHAAGHTMAAQEIARQFVMAPSLRHTISDLISISRIISTIAPDSALMRALDASLRYGGLPAEIVPLFRATAEAAKLEGDQQLEALALHRLSQASFLGISSVGPEHIERVERLGSVGGFAAGAAAHLRSGLAQRAGDTDTALAALDDYHHFGPVSGTLLRAERLCDLGRPEQVAVGLGPDDLGEFAEGAEIFISLAMWLRGDAPPELAQDVVSEMLPAVVRRGATHPILSILGVATIIALAAGDNESARRRAREARELCTLGIGDTSSLFADVAAAAVAAVDDGDAAAAELLEPVGRSLARIGTPGRAQLLALPLIYVSLPASRPILDGMSFGPALSTAVAAGQALVELRETGSTAAAARLPWTLTDVLRVHVLPPHLVELACAAADAGNDDASSLLMTIPNVSEHLARVEEVSAPAAQRYASLVLGSIPRRPPTQLRANLLGPSQLFRDGELVTTDVWQRRPLVRELCAILLERRRVARGEVIELLWPGHHDQERANASLRTALSTLQRVLEPDRPKSTEPFFLRADGDLLILDASVVTDVDRFEALMTSAISDDQAGSPASALTSYQEALALYGGDYVEGADSSWLLMNRLRLRALAMTAMCRVSELVAARGEPEEAARWAQRARLVEPLDQRAGRLFVAALDASGQPASARAALDDLRSVLAANGIGLERPTQRLIERLHL